MFPTSSARQTSPAGFLTVKDSPKYIAYKSTFVNLINMNTFKHCVNCYKSQDGHNRNTCDIQHM